jgi:hypothetical protein
MCSLAAMRPSVGRVPEHTVRNEAARPTPDAARIPHTHPYVVYNSPFGRSGEPFWACLHPLVRRVGRHDVTTDLYTLVSEKRTNDDAHKFTHPNRQAVRGRRGMKPSGTHRACMVGSMLAPEAWVRRKI